MSKAQRKALLEVYDRLFACYGPQHWWPAEGPFEVIVGAILTQSAAWSNVEKAISNLKRAGVLNPAGLRDLPEAELARLVYPSGYYNAKARKLKAFVHWFGENYGDNLTRLSALPTPELREQLLSVKGIGEETADSIILYATGKPIFVVDAYSRRIMHRLGLRPAAEPYASTQAYFMRHLPHDVYLFNEYHALLVRHGKNKCRKQPLCEGCCLKDRCRASVLR